MAIIYRNFKKLLEPPKKFQKASWFPMSPLTGSHPIFVLSKLSRLRFEVTKLLQLKLRWRYTFNLYSWLAVPINYDFTPLVMSSYYYHSDERFTVWRRMITSHQTFPLFYFFLFFYKINFWTCFETFGGQNWSLICNWTSINLIGYWTGCVPSSSLSTVHGDC